MVYNLQYKNERLHHSIDRTLFKLLEEDETISLEDALSHAVSSHNKQVTKTGFSPHQLQYGDQPVIPGITDGTPASMGPIVNSDYNL